MTNGCVGAKLHSKCNCIVKRLAQTGQQMEVYNDLALLSEVSYLIQKTSSSGVLPERNVCSLM
jgi:hypothetical protein